VLIKILDWGLACLRRPGGGASGNAPGRLRGIIGTADYLSPEQAKNADAADIRSDIYSLGCTLYFLLTGQPPFPGGTLPQKLLQHQTAEPTPVESFNPDVPPGLTGVLRRMMAKRPQDRYQTPAALALALTPYCRAQAYAAGVRRDVRPSALEETVRRRDDTPVLAALQTEGHDASSPAPHGPQAPGGRSDARIASCP
jgi:serine/threonine-protein kinase